MVSRLGFGLQLFRLGANAVRTRFDSLSVLEGGLQIDVLFDLGGDVGVAACEAIHCSATADGAGSCHREEK